MKTIRHKNSQKVPSADSNGSMIRSSSLLTVLASKESLTGQMGSLKKVSPKSLCSISVFIKDNTITLTLRHLVLIELKKDSNSITNYTNRSSTSKTLLKGRTSCLLSTILITSRPLSIKDIELTCRLLTFLGELQKCWRMAKSRSMKLMTGKCACCSTVFFQMETQFYICLLTMPTIWWNSSSLRILIYKILLRLSTKSCTFLILKESRPSISHFKRITLVLLMSCWGTLLFMVLITIQEQLTIRCLNCSDLRFLGCMRTLTQELWLHSKQKWSKEDLSNQNKSQ